MSSHGKRELRADAARNRQHLVITAKDIIVDRGGDAPLEAIARQAGVGIATLYRNFPTRRDLLQGIAEHTLTAARDLIRRIEEEKRDPLEILRGFLHGMLDLKLGALLPIVQGQIQLDATLRETSAEIVERVQATLSHAQKIGEIREDLLFGDLALMVMRMSRPMLAPGFPHDSELAHRQLELYIEGLRASPHRTQQPLPGPRIDGERFLQLRDYLISTDNTPSTDNPTH